MRDSLARVSRAALDDCSTAISPAGAEAFFRPDPGRAPTGANGLQFVRTAGMASGAVTTADVLAVLQPIWLAKPWSWSRLSTAMPTLSAPRKAPSRP